MKTLLTLFAIISAQLLFAQTQPLFLIVEKGRVGYINAQGETVISPAYWNGNDFSEGLAAVRQNGYYGFINEKGDFVIKPEYGAYWHFSIPNYQGEIKAKIRAELKYINKQDPKTNKIIYSNEIDGSVNPAQFWWKPRYNPDGIMDPYLE